MHSLNDLPSQTFNEWKCHKISLEVLLRFLATHSYQLITKFEEIKSLIIIRCKRTTQLPGEHNRTQVFWLIDSPKLDIAQIAVNFINITTLTFILRLLFTALLLDYFSLSIEYVTKFFGRLLVTIFYHKFSSFYLTSLEISFFYVNLFSTAKWWFQLIKNKFFVHFTSGQW